MDKILLGKRILIVDDEHDVRETLCDLLSNCKLDMAASYDEAKDLLETNEYDIAILDIMGVNGYELLAIANEKKVPSVMLTAHAFSADNLLKSAEEGAVYYAPKEELINITSIVSEVLDAIENNKSTWEKMFHRLAGFYDRQFNGPDWREQKKEFWNKKINKLGY